MGRFALDFRLRLDAFAVDLRMEADAGALALFGPSGSGKTSVLEAIAGLRTPETGHIAIDGRMLFDRHAHIDVPPRLRRIGYVPQDMLLFPHLDVRQNVEYGRRPGARPEFASLVDLLELGALLDRRIGSLSGGERQRVAIARALYSAPDVLLLDEPLAAVDAPRRRRIVTVLMRIREELDVPLVYVTHAAEEAIEVADVAIVLESGRTVACGPPRDVLRS